MPEFALAPEQLVALDPEASGFVVDFLPEEQVVDLAAAFFAAHGSMLGDPAPCRRCALSRCQAYHDFVGPAPLGRFFFASLDSCPYALLLWDRLRAARYRLIQCRRCKTPIVARRPVATCPCCGLPLGGDPSFGCQSTFSPEEGVQA